MVTSPGYGDGRGLGPSLSFLLSEWTLNKVERPLVPRLLGTVEDMGGFHYFEQWQLR